MIVKQEYGVFSKYIYFYVPTEGIIDKKYHKNYDISKWNNYFQLR